MSIKSVVVLTGVVCPFPAEVLGARLVHGATLDVCSPAAAAAL